MLQHARDAVYFFLSSGEKRLIVIFWHGQQRRLVRVAVDVRGGRLKVHGLVPSASMILHVAGDGLGTSSYGLPSTLMTPQASRSARALGSKILYGTRERGYGGDAVLGDLEP